MAGRKLQGAPQHEATGHPAAPGQGCDRVPFAPSSRPRGCWRGWRMGAAPTLLSRQLLSSLLRDSPRAPRGLAAAWLPLPRPATAAQESAASIWISPSSVSWSHCSEHLGLLCPQHLGVPSLNTQVLLFSASASSHCQRLDVPVLSQEASPLQDLPSLFPVSVSD